MSWQVLVFLYIVFFFAVISVDLHDERQVRIWSLLMKYERHGVIPSLFMREWVMETGAEFQEMRDKFIAKLDDHEALYRIKHILDGDNVDKKAAYVLEYYREYSIHLLLGELTWKNWLYYYIPFRRHW